MITLEDCIGMCGLTEEEILAIAEHEHLPEVAATALAQYLLSREHGSEYIRDMIIEDVRQAQWSGNKEHVLTLLHVLHRTLKLGRVDGFDQDEAESKRDERAVILRRLLASKCDTLEAFELADRLFNACPCLVECFRKEGGHILGVGSIRDCRTYSALARGVAI